MEALLTIAPLKSVRSFRESGQAKALQYARTCYDHLAGSLGAALTSRLFQLKWIERLPDGRAVRVTDAGAKGLSEEFGLKVIDHSVDY